MNPYLNFYTILFLGFVLIYFYLRTIKYITVDKPRLLFFFVILYGFAAIRAENVGGDLDHYLRNFHELQSTSWANIFDLFYSNYEYGYTVAVKIMAMITANERIFFWVTPFLSLAGVYWLIKEKSVIPILSILLYMGLGFYTNTYNNVRQSIAMSLCCFALPFIEQRKMGRFSLVVCVATLFHTSAMFYWLIFPLSRIQISGSRFFWIVTLGVITFFSLGISVFNYFRDAVFIDYATDNDSEYLVAGKGYSLLFMYVVLTVCTYYLFKHKKSQGCGSLQYYNILLWSMLLATFSQALATQMATFTRMSSYFYLMIILIVPELIHTREPKNIKYYCCVSVALLLFYMGYAVFRYVPELNSNSQAVLPYKTNLGHFEM